MYAVRKSILLSLFCMVLHAADSGFALAWEHKGYEISEQNLRESATQLWGFVDLVKVIAIGPEELEAIMNRCSAYIVELYVHMRKYAHKNQTDDIAAGITIFKECCAELAQVEQQHHKRCGLFCLLLLDMHEKLSNIPIYNQY